MADKKTSQLAPAEPLTGSEIIAVSQEVGGVLESRRVTAQEVADLGGGGGGGIPDAPINGSLYGRKDAAWVEIAPGASPSLEVTASRTLSASDAGKFISANHASTAIALTVPPNSSVAYPVDTEIHIRQRGAATVSVVAGAGVTINQPGSQTLALAERYSVVTLKKVSVDTWALFGDLGAAP